MSIAFLEAMALGMPVVASSISGNERLIAILHKLDSPTDNPAQLAQIIIEQWDNFHLAIEMGREHDIA